MKLPAVIAKAAVLKLRRLVRRVVRIGILGTAVAVTLVALDALLLRDVSSREDRSIRD